MSRYAIGDIQGCYGALNRLLDKVKFDPGVDTLWIAGDLVNRGKKSLKVLRFLKKLGDNAVCVLGNHDITLIAIHHGFIKPNDTLKPVLKADDREELIQWLSTQPLLQVDHDNRICMAHAGIPPHWTVAEALLYSREVQLMMQSPMRHEWLRNVYGNQPAKWDDSLEGFDRHRYIINGFTRMRFMRKTGELNFDCKMSPFAQSKYTPWFKFADRKNRDYKIIFGHWASLGYYQGENVIALDTGCVWGGKLTAINMDKLSVNKVPPISVSCS